MGRFGFWRPMLWRSMRGGVAAVVWPVALAAPLAAQDIALSLPVDCRLNESCYIQHYVDEDPGPGLRDYACGTTTYAEHDGTDFALPTRAAMRAGVSVLAAAPGTVRAIRDGEADGAFVAGQSVKDKECGNGVVIDHAEGWQTQYCHLQRGSIAVAPGDEVAAGDRLGLIGESGMAEFPHLHLTVRHDGAKVDPFRPDPATDCSPAPARTLWQTPPAYVGGGLLQIGLADAPPDFGAAKAGLSTPETLPATAPALVLWAYGYESHAGDVMSFAISGPDGFRFAHEAALEKAQALFFRYAGKRAPAEGLPPGQYSATLTLTRDGREIGRNTAEITVAPR